MKRLMSVNGTFYPSDKSELKSMINYFNEVAEQHFVDRIYSQNPVALIVPHAGFIYSGFTANLAYRNVTKIPKRVIVIGPSHRVAFDGISLNDYVGYDTPLGEIDGDREYVSQLKEKFSFVSIEHKEHSTEVQFPFIKFYFEDIKLIEMVYSTTQNLVNILDYLLKNDENLVIISTDLSHFYDEEKAHRLDSFIIKAVENLDLEMLKNGEACGMLGVASVLEVAKRLGLSTKSIDYRTSANITKDKSSVVGYYSAMVY